ncbi:hypothetical protein THAOC_10581 [Thalassiosira oceanica]|uniref:Uncharacterized protein n=1 Tax=Thalassiosira oceanica TaxID=159749 RepID=K0SPP4_THAOC|nr:hypothetical protein THAOC_10581 [Thalassiosira oceanica]|eukprot:EJK68258.1 hypothetical protein THAOC_10581 [Thalassiosira oceanica]
MRGTGARRATTPTAPLPLFHGAVFFDFLSDLKTTETLRSRAPRARYENSYHTKSRIREATRSNARGQGVQSTQETPRLEQQKTEFAQDHVADPGQRPARGPHRSREEAPVDLLLHVHANPSLHHLSCFHPEEYVPKEVQTFSVHIVQSLQDYSRVAREGEELPSGPGSAQGAMEDALSEGLPGELGVSDAGRLLRLVHDEMHSQVVRNEGRQTAAPEERPGGCDDHASGEEKKDESGDDPAAAGPLVAIFDTNAKYGGVYLVSARKLHGAVGAVDVFANEPRAVILVEKSEKEVSPSG